MKKKRGMNKVDAVFFDAGETIIHPEPSFSDLFLQTCSGLGINHSREEVSRLTAELIRELEEMQERGYTFTTSDRESKRFWLRFYRRLLEGLGVGKEREDLAESLFIVFSDPGNYRLYDDVLPALEELKSYGYILGVISNFEPWLLELLENLGVRGYFQTLSISGLVGAEKPQRAIFDRALGDAGVEPSQALHVGDSLRTDVEGARRVGIAPILLDRRGLHPDPPCPRLKDLRELPELLRRRSF